ncbi:MAG: aminoacyl--tRNA ligase-related protein [Patescibacteria group bacterium]
MKITDLFVKTTKNIPADEQAVNAKLLIQAGYVHKEMAGVYSYLPLGLMVLENIKKIVREEMNSIGSSELIMTSLQRKELWEKTNRWSDKEVDVWFKSRLKNGTEVGFGWSHEEPITDMMRNFVSSYRDLPIYVYQFQTKLRNELRAKSGIMRGREFVMKDLYSYSLTEEDHEKFYQQVVDAYSRVFKRVGLGDATHFTYASGGAFTQFSHEFQTECEAGEDIIHIDRKSKVAINDEILSDAMIKKLKVDQSNLEKVKTAEVGNIFSFGAKKSEELGLYFTDEKGDKKPVILGSYGIGITRLMGVIVEKFSDNKGLVWPEEVAPFKVYLATIGDDKAVHESGRKLYEFLQKAGVSVLYDDRDLRAGEKFATCDMIGIPQRLVVSEKTIKNKNIEFKKRQNIEAEFIHQKDLEDLFAIKS